MAICSSRSESIKTATVTSKTSAIWWANNGTASGESHVLTGAAILYLGRSLDSNGIQGNAREVKQALNLRNATP